ncbi:RND transporter [Chromobacterium sp. LK1]|uniref:efflux RND transporter periplasmic adaptor subunit n=1 Tax=Chromobacterium sp. LK1 TaxID=1628193 RepID=UPI0006538EE2|nr:efflux RND transporter periplasmic adaptor subunit [Chromobacterium sp. LK1]KMN32738.1 RND transporter [Chromobacterium sp. LK1]
MNTRFVSVLTLLLALTACSGKPSEAPQTAAGKGGASAPAARALSSADVVVATPRPLAATISFTGSLNALTSGSLAAEVEARVKEVRVREGEAVKRGQVLAVLDAEVLSQSVTEQNAQVANTEARLRLAKVKLEKQRELLHKGFISQIAYDEFDSDYRVKEGEAKAQATQLARARRLLADTQIRAPIDGVVYERKINPGEVAGKSAVLFAIADLSVLEIAATVPARLISQIQPGMRASFTVDGQSEPQHGEVVRINPVAVPGTRSFTLYIRVKNPEQRLKVGQFAKGGIVLKQLDGQVVLPLPAIHDPDGQAWVMVVKKGRLERRPVRLLLRSEADRLAAVEGVTAGEPVIAVDLVGVKAGDPVSLPSGKF